MIAGDEPLGVNLGAIPQALQEREQWLVWKHDKQPDGRLAKVPYNARSGRKAQTTNPATWAPFVVAASASRRGYAGPGFVFTADDDFVGVDLDGCRDPESGELAPWAKPIIEALASYAEVSPSGSGVKIFCRGKLAIPAGKKKKWKIPGAPTVGGKEAGVEVYDRGRFFCVTGLRLDGPTEPQEAQAALDALITQQPKRTTAPQPQNSAGAKPRESKASRPSLAERTWLYIQKMPISEAGNYGHDAAFAVACVIWKFGNSEADGAEVFRRYSDTCAAPWSEAEQAHKLASAREAVEAAGEFGKLAKDQRGVGHQSNRQRGQGESSGRELPKIDLSSDDLPKLTGAAWRALQAANDPPFLFRFGGVPSRIESDDHGAPIIAPLDVDRMRFHMARCADWTRWKRAGEESVEVAAKPPVDVVRDVLASDSVPLPLLMRIAEAPAFAPDGTLHDQPGYHPATRIVYAPSDGFRVRPIPDYPTAREIASATGIITTELLGDFPFVSPSERAHAVALLLQPFCRELIQGPTPLYLFEKPSPGTGATLLVDLLTSLATGRGLVSMTEGRDEDEWRKRLTAKFCSAPLFLLIDNLRRRLDSAAVASAITATIWEDRILGISKVVRLPVRCTWIATGNNPTVSSEIARRTIRVRLNAKTDRPWLRTGFRHPDIRAWSRQNRGELVWAALTLIRAWLASGRPLGSQKLGMFESWSEVIGGILATAGIPGFLANLEEFYDDSDAEGVALRAFVGSWWEQHFSNEVKVAELYALAKGDAGLPMGDGNEQSQKVRLGKLLSDIRERIFDLDGQRVQIFRGKQRQRAYSWRLRQLGELEIESCECGESSESSPPIPHAHARAHAPASDMGAVANTHEHSQTHFDGMPY